MQEIRKRNAFKSKAGFLLRVLLGFLVAFPLLGLFPWGIPAAGAAQVTLSWTPNAEADIAGYIVSYGTSSGSYTTAVDVGKMSSCSLDGLQSGQTYYFAAKAYNTSRLESGFSNEVNYTIPATTTSPTTTKKGQGKRK